MQERFISLLYPTEDSQSFHSYRDNLPNISDDVCDELGLTELFDLKSSMLGDFFTSDVEVIKYRQQTMSDVANIPELKRALAEVHPILDDIRQLRRLDLESANSGDSYLYSITEIELYVSCIDMLSQSFLYTGGSLYCLYNEDLGERTVSKFEAKYLLAVYYRESNMLRVTEFEY